MLKIVKHLNYSKHYNDYSPFLAVFNEQDEFECIDHGCWKTREEAESVLNDAALYISKFETLEELREDMKIY